MQEANTQPRDTGDVKAKLKSYGALQRRIDYLFTRLEYYMEMIDTLPSMNYSGMPSSGSPGLTKQERYVEKKDDIEQRINKLTDQEKILRKELEDAVSMIDDPDEQAVLAMRYIDLLEWKDVAFSIFGMLDEYYENTDRYMKRTFRLHGDALQHLAAVFIPK